MAIIHVVWEGFPYEKALELNDSNDYGVYQIYGAHPVYGSNVLLYIGKAGEQTFGKRLGQHEWTVYNADAGNVTVYVGRLGGYDGTPQNEEWSRQIALVERLLIYAHQPACNASGLNVLKPKQEDDDAVNDAHILNWGQRRDLLPEVSGARWHNRFDSDEGYEDFSA
ncbi:MAG: hypothetical protein LBQ75_10355 [Zoogloeaceae bacterium]|jgi:hypothetical protein|nr:hypothetical protein [Zoogloeaceae bacterium]